METKKYVKDLVVKAVERPHDLYVLLKLTDEKPLPVCRPGQFVEILVEGSPRTFLRRPISIHYVDVSRNELWLLVKMVGEGTRMLGKLKAGDCLNMVFPLGNGFSPVQKENERVLLVGGGVGIAPLLDYGRYLKENGACPVFLLGARSKNELVEQDLFRHIAPVYVTTEDGTEGECGFVTQHSLLNTEKFDRISVCGPKPMMVSVAKYARSQGTPCEVSLENMMACGVGACLCCVEKTVKGNVCVCKEGPVFDINDLTWEI